jgi:hypothetical protein
MDATRYLVMSGRERMRVKPVAPIEKLIYTYPGQSAQGWMA